jgi:hypothetical protein
MQRERRGFRSGDRRCTIARPETTTPSRGGRRIGRRAPVKPGTRRNVQTAYAKFCAAKSQFAMFQNASTNFGRALR